MTSLRITKLTTIFLMETLNLISLVMIKTKLVLLLNYCVHYRLSNTKINKCRSLENSQRSNLSMIEIFILKKIENAISISLNENQLPKLESSIYTYYWWTIASSIHLWDIPDFAILFNWLHSTNKDSLL